MSADVDPVTMTVISNYLTTTAREMGVAMMETSYSSVFNEALDFSCAVFDDKAEILAQAEFCPSMLGAMHFALQWTIEEFGKESFGPSDVYIHNDPYRGMAHLPEHMVAKAVYYGNEIAGFVGCIGHMTEVGGRSPGGFPGDVTDVFQEGLRIPPVKIIKNGIDDEDIWRLILANWRTPRVNTGDIRAMIGSLYVGERRVVELIDRYGLETYRKMSAAIKDHQEGRMRESIRHIPDGVYVAEDYVMDNDGITDVPARLKVQVIVDGDEVTVDYSGADKQRAGPINCTYAAAASATYNAFLQLTDLELAANSGCYRPIHIISPPGTIVHVEYPGAEVGGNSEMHAKIVFLIIRALAPAIPDQVAASDIGSSALVSYGGHNPETNEFYSNLLIEVGGWGGRCSGDGNDCCVVPNANCRVTPVEVLETRYPLLHERFSLNIDSGGPGKYRGGLGTVREWVFLAPETTLASFVEREQIDPWGLFGGQPGANCGIFVKRDGDDDYRTFKEAFGTACNAKFSGILLRSGDRLRIVTGGGGGFGAPAERDVESIMEDIREGYCTSDHVLTQYGVVIQPEDA